MHCAVCLFTPQFSLVLIARTHGGMARLSLPGWLVTRTQMVYSSAKGHPYITVDATNDVTNGAKRQLWELMESD